MTTVADILTTRTRDQLVTELMAALAAEGLPVTAWQEGGAARSLVKADATALADLYLTVQALGAAGFLSTATGGWLTLLAASRFDVARFLSTFASGFVRVACAASAGPYNIPAGALLVTDAAGHRYRSGSAGYVVPSGSYVDVLVTAESPGADYNLAAGTSLTIVSPAYAGLSVTNPALSGSTTWLTVSARDEETDAELRLRCRARWATLGTGFTNAAVIYWVLSALLADGTATGITRAAVEPGPSDGTYTVYVASANGAAVSDAVTAAQTTLNQHKPITDTPTVISAAERNVAVTAQVFAVGGITAGQILELENRLFVLAASVEIGGWLYISDIYAELSRPLLDGKLVDHVALAAPAANTMLLSNEVLKITPTLTSGSV